MSNQSRVWSDALRAELGERLERERQALLRTVVATDEELATLERHEPGGLVEDAATQATSVLLSRLEGRERHEVDEIDDALARLARGAYGNCEACGRLIPLERLRAMPAARLCVDCQKKHEPR
jgi:RNA polymerase-binding transcription factor